MFLTFFVHVISMIGQAVPCRDQTNKIIWVAHLSQKLFEIVCLMLISAVQGLPFHCYSLLEIGMWVISIHIYLICIFVIKGSWHSKDSKASGMRDKWDFPLRLDWGYISAESKNDWMDIKLYFSLGWSEVLIPRMAMMTLKYTWTKDMCLWVQMAKTMPNWRLSALSFIYLYFRYIKSCQSLNVS